MKRDLVPGEVLLEDAWRSFPARSDRAATLKELFTSFRTRRHPQLPDTQALAGVSLHVNPGETVGIIGRNGAGKTSTLRVLAGIIPLHRGQAECGGRVATLIELGAGFGREFTGRENIRKAFCNFDRCITFSSSAKRMLHYMQAKLSITFKLIFCKELVRSRLVGKRSVGCSILSNADLFIT